MGTATTRWSHTVTMENSDNAIVTVPATAGHRPMTPLSIHAIVSRLSRSYAMVTVWPIWGGWVSVAERNSMAAPSFGEIPRARCRTSWFPSFSLTAPLHPLLSRDSRDSALRSGGAGEESVHAPYQRERDQQSIVGASPHTVEFS